VEIHEIRVHGARREAPYSPRKRKPA
jgi:hypothetical protein